ncbi:MAG: hypothetical protein ACD_25C00050G0004 [uncultured bacterium]|uniref:Uncharacterized protein n=2 Tax=Katanobacteria TaxID=422282 RepID=A0A0G1GXH3_UNCKA|nr:MAG: hypothetical protein ACD_25C00050G0004 [uncultured bacterium]KKT12052.1 MAG: hypothetical protein UV89_C0005G0008 [candidate division WWE3 bacterium GW2011_GWB2_43_22]OGC58436.1 MAG: hypothetical protein A2245_02575 [candidate division WWE3 bacterium RIFOXYA2_FULL_43_12]OGC65141.1 MAG: hypothetical protein A2274_00370 [candidate division WWE3 bacterium RIFOXYA12_FULL_43_11]OGC73314.1 MAG: hypothetical protein A2337_03160 [candidate division WWE3 bacterium RIFOXYB2_FULL_43_9]OGC73533.1 
MNSDSAKSGFKTFILTLSISLIVFSVVYYLVTNTGAGDSSAPYQASIAPVTTGSLPSDALALETGTEQVAGVSDTSSDSSTFSTDSSVFGEIVDKPVGAVTVNAGVVLAGATSSPTTQTTGSGAAVPETGVVGITAGLLVSLVFFLTGMYYIASNPRKSALGGFEKKILKDN